MSYHPDHELCLVTFDQQEEVPPYKRESFLKEFLKKGDKEISWQIHKEVVQRNQIHLGEARAAIGQARKAGYKPVFSMFQKGEYTIVGAKKGQRGWRGITADKLANGNYTDRTKMAVTNVIGKKNSTKELQSWEEVIKLASAPKTNNQQKNRQGNRQGNRRPYNNNRRNQEDSSSQDNREQKTEEVEKS